MLTADKVPPHSLEAETAVLGAILLDNSIFPAVAETVAADDFYRTGHQIIFRSICRKLAEGGPADIVTVIEDIRKAGAIEKAGEANAIAELTNQVPSTAHALYYAAKVKECANRRAVIRQALTLADSAYDRHTPLEDTLAQFDIGVDMSAGAHAAKVEDGLGADLKYLEKLYNGEMPECVPTGFYDIDNMLQMQESDLIVVGGRPGMGKTAFALSVAVNASTKGHPTAFFSMEMSDQQLRFRISSMLSGINSRVYRTGKFGPDDWPRLSGATGRMSSLPLWIDGRSALTVSQIRAEAANLKRKHGVKFIIIDHLGKIGHTDHKASDYTKISNAASGCKDIAKALGLPVMLLAQLSRKVESRNPPIPSMADIRESGRVEEEADSMGFLYRQDYYSEQGFWEAQDGKQRDKKMNPALEGKGLFLLSKHRHGPTGKAILGWKPETASYFNVDSWR